jgi:DNA primase
MSGVIARRNAAPTTHMFRLARSGRGFLDQSRNTAIQAICMPFVNLARNPMPMASPRTNHSSDVPRCKISQPHIAANAQKKTLSVSIVMRIDPTASMGITVAISRHQSAMRSS